MFTSASTNLALVQIIKYQSHLLFLITISDSLDIYYNLNLVLTLFCDNLGKTDN